MTWQREPDWPDERLRKTTEELWRRVNPRNQYPLRQRGYLDPCDLLVGENGVLDLGYLRRAHRCFAPLDVVFLRFRNGGGKRCEVFGWSTKLGRFVSGLYLPYARYRRHPHYTQHEERAIVGRVARPGELPDEIGRKPWFDPDVRRLAADWLRVADSGSSLGAATGGAISS